MTTSTAFPVTWPVARLVERLQQHQPELAARYQVDSLGVFGSYIHNTQHEDSDLDVLVTFSQTPSLFTLVQLQDDLSALLGVPVDVTMKDDLKRRIGQRILQEAVNL